MESAADVLRALARRHAFGDLGALAADDPSLAPLCAFGQRVLDLDAEDFGMPETVGDVPADLLDRARLSRMPQSPKERSRGALTSLRPAYALLLEVARIRWERREMAALVAAVHIAAEYLPMLAWEPVLGHAGDPALLGAAVAGPGSRFGVTPDRDHPRECEHTYPERSACSRALRVAKEPGPGWRAYLDRQHSQVSSALGDCAGRCRTPCTVITRVGSGDRDALMERARLAMDFRETAIVRLRHAAPVGHGFGVPSPEEVGEAWKRATTSLGRRPLGERALADVHPGYPLPGLPELFTAVAAAPIAPDTLLREVRDRLLAALGS